jgi:ELWxxDGT repeat protein
VLALLVGHDPTAHGSAPAAGEAAESPSAQVAAPWVPCGRTAVPLGPELPDFDPEPSDPVHAGQFLFFFTGDAASGGALWASTGTGGGRGTFKVRDFPPGPTGTAPSQLTRVGDKVFFSAEDADHGRELWVSDGTPDGTRRVTDLWPGPTGSFPRSLFEHQGRLYFTAGDEDHGRELRMTDGTAEGTVLVSDLVPGPEGSDPNRLTRSGDGAIYFIAQVQDIFTALMRMDPATGTPVELLRVPSEGAVIGDPTPVGSRVFFVIGDLHGHEFELRMSDGGPPSLVAKLTHVGEMVAMGGRLYFAGAQDEEGMDLELWRTDGTPRGTRRVKDLSPGDEGSDPSHLTVLGRRLFFSADDGAHGRELWVSDGTEAGTSLFAELEPGEGGAAPESMKVLQGNLFFSATTVGRGTEPWMSNGTPEGTVPLDELAPGASDSFPRAFVRSGWDAFFTAEDGAGARRLWALPFRPGGQCPPPRR